MGVINKDLVIFFYPRVDPQNQQKNLPMSVLKLASGVVAAGYRAKIIDARIQENYAALIEEVLDEALCLCVSCMTGHQINDAVEVSRQAKNKVPGLPVIWGGWHPSLLPEQTLASEYIDIVVRGQGEKTLLEIIDALKINSGLSGIRGVSFKDKNKVVISNSAREFEDINNFAGINFSLLDVNNYVHESPLGKRTIYWNTSQGCPFRCAFCCTSKVYGRHWSSLKVEKILGDLKVLSNRFSVDSVIFAEDNFFTDEQRVKQICEGLLKESINIKWATDARIDRVIHFDNDFLSLVKRSGCVKLYLGAESGSQEVLDFVDKDLKVDYTLEAAKMLSVHGIIAEFFLMVGFPLNPRKDLQDTLNMMRLIKKAYPNHQATAFLYTPYPGTKLFDFSVARGFIPPNSLLGWSSWSVLTPTVPWIDRSYMDKANRFIKFYFPFAYPSASLLQLMHKGFSGILYRMMHLLAKIRVEYNIFILPLEWHAVKYFYYGIKLKHGFFKNMAVPR